MFESFGSFRRCRVDVNYLRRDCSNFSGIQRRDCTVSDPQLPACFRQNSPVDGDVAPATARSPDWRASTLTSAVPGSRLLID